MKILNPHKNIAKTRAYKRKRQALAKTYNKYRSAFEETKDSISPSGDYRIMSIPCYEEEKQVGHTVYLVRNIDSLLVKDMVKDVEHLNPIFTDSSHFWYTWIQHEDGNEYALIGEDKRGYTCFNMTDKKKYVYFPREALKEPGMCWKYVFVSPNTKQLCVERKYTSWDTWDIAIYDISKPLSLPYPQLIQGTEDPHRDFSIIGWQDETSLLVEGKIEIRKSDNAIVRQLPPKEQEILDEHFRKQIYDANLKKETTQQKQQRQQKQLTTFKKTKGVIYLKDINNKEDHTNCWEKVEILNDNS